MDSKQESNPDKELDPDQTSDEMDAVKPARRVGERRPIPALREVPMEPVQVPSEGKGEGAEEEMVVVLQDPDGLAEQPAVLSPAAYALAQLFDGHRTAEEVAQAFRGMYGQSVAPDEVERLQEELDRTLFLESPRFEAEVGRQIGEYLDADVRPYLHSGESYPDDPDELRKFILAMFADEDGPGEEPPAAQAEQDTVKGMVLPHIDMRVGGATYAHGYQRLLNRSQADLFVILGVAHQCPPGALFCVSTKHFDTVLGQVNTAVDLARDLRDASGMEPRLAEFAHKKEFSIEFQATLLKALYGERMGQDFEILPILCGPIEPFMDLEENPLNEPRFTDFVTTLREHLDKSGRNWSVIASVDFSHVGPKFGHSTGMEPRLLPTVERADRKLLGLAAKLDAEAFFQEVMRTRNSRNIDGVIAVLTALQLGRDRISSGELLHYDQMLEDATKSAVSYASMSFSS